MCDIDIAVTLEEYTIVEKSELYYRRSLGRDVQEVGSDGYFTDEDTGIQYMWVKYFDHKTGERIRVRRDKIIGLGS